MARKTVFLFLLICLLGGMLLFADRPAFLYPELPFPSVSKQTLYPNCEKQTAGSENWQPNEAMSGTALLPKEEQKKTS